MNRTIWRMNGSRAAKGFTLVELLVTLAIVAIMVSIGVPMYGGFTKGTAITSRSSELVAAINYTRSEAVSRRASVRLAPLSGSWSNGWQVSTVAAVTTPLRVVDLSSSNADVAITEGGGLAQLDFDGQGRASAAPTYTICPKDGGTGRTITVNMFGRVRVVTLVCP